VPEGIKPGNTIFIDTNIILYAIYDHWKYGQPSTALLDSIDLGEYNGLTSVLVCSEVFHNTMLAEVTERECIHPGSAVTYLKENPEIIGELHKPWDVLTNIKKINHLRILGIDESALELSATYSKMYGLLSHDALHLAVMKQNEINILASNDRDFDRVDWIRLWKP
jgi:predicted nucleic acid-binding protein